MSKTPCKHPQALKDRKTRNQVDGCPRISCTFLLAHEILLEWQPARWSITLRSGLMNKQTWQQRQESVAIASDHRLGRVQRPIVWFSFWLTARLLQATARNSQSKRLPGHPGRCLGKRSALPDCRRKCNLSNFKEFEINRARYDHDVNKFNLNEMWIRKKFYVQEA